MNKSIIFKIVIIVMGSIFLLFYTMKPNQPTPPDQKFEVVDTYRGCSVVRYSPTNAARYTYFLDCKK